jgi:hypothetical protein
MSQPDNKYKTHEKTDQQKPGEDIQKHIENTRKKVNIERSKYTTDQQLKDIVTRAHLHN